MAQFDTKLPGRHAPPGVDRRTALACLAGTAWAPRAWAGSHAFEVLHAFGSVGANGSLVQTADGWLHGANRFGGKHGVGEVYRCSVNDELQVVHAFDYLDPLGWWPRAGLCLAADGRFYGTCARGGSNDWGTVFVVDTSGKISLVHEFARTDGMYPDNELLAASDGNLYGTTPMGGELGCGVHYRVTPDGEFSVLRHLRGRRITAKLIEATDGYLYTAAAKGGEFHEGAVIRITPDGSEREKAVHAFADDRHEGAFPTGVLQQSDGSLVGVTGAMRLGRRDDTAFGTFFRLSLDGELTVLHRFTGRYHDAGGPSSELIQDASGRLYGVSRYGGMHDDGGSPEGGTVYALDADGSVELLHRFNPYKYGGYLPAGALLAAADGLLYGTTTEGGGIFRLNPG